jgi:penicillin-binding protein 2
MDRERLLKRRFFTLTALFAGSIGLLVMYLFFLQIIRGGEFSQKAKDVSQRDVMIPAQRGKIFDRNADFPLVYNIDSFAVDVIPGEVDPRRIPSLFKELSAVLGVPVSEIGKRIPAKSYSLFQPIEVKSGVSMATISYLAEHMDRFMGVSWHNKPIRSYLGGATLAHVIGYVGIIEDDELQVLYNKGYLPGAVIGKSGIEKEYDEILRGKDGKSYRLVDVTEKNISGEGDQDNSIPPIPPVAGQNIVLTLDRTIQKIAEEALGERRGSVVVLKPATGEVLALVSYPSFDPNRFYASDASSYFNQLFAEPGAPFLNRAIQSARSPGSAFKIVMTTAVVDDATIPINRAVLCTGRYQLGDRTFRCWVPTGHGYEDLMGGLAQSCDVYFYTVGNELGVDKIDSYARDFNLGMATGIDLPDEKSGLLPTPEWKERTRREIWVGGDTLNFSIGQGFLTMTPLQMADMLAMVVNSGVIYRPHLVKEIRDPQSGAVVSVTKPEILHTSHISADVFKTVQEALRGVIVKGTAAPVVTTKAVEVAGKTGTAEVGIEGQWDSWFAAYGPYQTDKPLDRIVVVVMVEASENWEWWAPKAANLIFQAIFAHQSFDQAVATLRPWYYKVKGRAE